MRFAEKPPERGVFCPGGKPPKRGEKVLA